MVIRAESDFFCAETFELLRRFTEYGGLDAALPPVEKITWAGKRALVRS